MWLSQMFREKRLNKINKEKNLGLQILWSTDIDCDSENFLIILINWYTYNFVVKLAYVSL